MSERRARKAMGFGRASHRYQSRRDPGEERRVRLKELAESRVRYGCRRLDILLQREGGQVNCYPAGVCASHNAERAQAPLPVILRRRPVDPHPEPEATPCLPVSIRSIRG